MIPIPFAVHRVIVHPDRSDGENAVDGRFLRSHFRARGSALGPASGFRDILGTGGELSNGLLRWVPYFKNHVSSSIIPIGRFPFEYSLQYPPAKASFRSYADGEKKAHIPWRITPSGVERKENPLLGLIDRRQTKDIG